MLRQALAGMLWSKQLYSTRSRAGRRDLTQPTPPAYGRRTQRPLATSTPSTSCPCRTSGVPVVRRGISPSTASLARRSGVREVPADPAAPGGFQHPNGALAAYEWSFDDVNPPVHAWPRSRCSRSTAPGTRTSSAGCSTRCSSTSPGGATARDDGTNLFGRVLGLDNIGPIDPRTSPRASGSTVRQHGVDGRAAEHGRDRVDPAPRRPSDGGPHRQVLEQFALISRLCNGTSGTTRRFPLRPPAAGTGQPVGRCVSIVGDPAGARRRGRRRCGRTRPTVHKRAANLLDERRAEITRLKEGRARP